MGDRLRICNRMVACWACARCFSEVEPGTFKTRLGPSACICIKFQIRFRLKSRTRCVRCTIYILFRCASKTVTTKKMNHDCSAHINKYNFVREDLVQYMNRLRFIPTLYESLPSFNYLPGPHCTMCSFAFRDPYTTGYTKASMLNN